MIPSEVIGTTVLRVGLLGYGLDRPSTGISRYTRELAKGIRNNYPDVKLTLLVPFPEPVLGMDGIRQVRLRGTRRLPALMAFGPTQLAITAKRLGLDVIHDPVGIAPFRSPLWDQTIARIVTIHDMVPYVYPESHQFLTNQLYHRYLPFMISRQVNIITDSEASRSDISRFFGIDSNRIERVLLGVGPEFAPKLSVDIESIRKQYEIEGPYILAVGAMHARKNVESLIEAFGIMVGSGLDHRLVLVGPRQWKSQGIFQSIDRLGLTSRVHLTGYVDDADLPGLYSGASCFVFPSLYEGFGLPPLEAMACGTPVVASNTSSMPEVLGDACLYVEPTSIDQIVESVLRIIGSADLHSTLRQKGLDHAAQFKWSDTVSAHVEIYKLAAEQARSRTSPA